MFAYKNKYYLIIESIKDLNIKNIKRYNKFIVIYRNKSKIEKISDLHKFRKDCKIKQVKFFVANDTNLATLIKADGLYISSYNKSFKNLCFRRKNFSFIGSAHNYREIELKKKQGCEIILVSKLFKVGYDPKSSYMGITKFNKKFLFDKKIIPLGGITICNLNSLKNTNSEGFALLSEVKKKPAKIFSRLF